MNSTTLEYLMPQGVTDGELVSQPWSTDFMLVKAHGILHQLGATARMGAASILLILSILVYSTAILRKKDVPQSTAKSPPMAPYWTPLIGHLVSWQRDSHALATRLLSRYGHAVPFGLKIATKNVYFLGDPKLADNLMRHNHGLSDVENICFVLKHVFGTDPNVVKSMYRDDDSGPGAKPYPGSVTPPERRARYLMSKSAREFLGGPNGVKLGIRYKDLLIRNLAQNRLLDGGEWKSYTDLWDFSYDLLFPASTEVIFGKRILDVNPSLASDIRGFLDDLPTFLGMWPRWLAPATYRRRDVALESIKNWIREIERHDVKNSGWDPQLGSDYIGERHRFLRKFEEVNIDVEAAETLGLFMGVVPNALGALYWTLFEVFTRPELVERIRPIVESVVDPTTGDIDTVKLSQDPLLQSILAEVIRIRVQGILLRSATSEIELEGWKFPKGAYLMAPTHFGHFNKNVWNTGTRDSPHPLDGFWPERFLIYPDTPGSGPLRSAHGTKVHRAQVSGSSSGPTYSEQGLKGAYFPFGGKMHPCPGRQFTQYEVLNTLAILVLNYDIEICIKPGWAPRMNTKTFGLGTLPPAEKLPFRIRRRCAL